MIERGPTIHDVARLAGVSNMTVSRVVNEASNVKEATRARVHAAMAQLGYKPNVIARGMRSNSTKTVGFVLPDLTNPLNATITQVVEAVLAAAGYRMLVATSRFDLDREYYYLEQFGAYRVDGIIAMLADDTSERVADLIRASYIPFVVIDRDVPAPVDAVLCEHGQAMAEVVRYLISLGHRRIGLINGPLSMRPARHRSTAFVEAMRLLEVEPHADLIRAPAPTVEDGFIATRELLGRPDRPTALVVCSNQNMFGALRAVKTLGLRIPHDLSFVGADEDLSTALFEPPVTIIHRDMALVGETAAQLLLERLGDRKLPQGRSLTVPSEVILRGSCAAPRGERHAGVETLRPGSHNG